MQLVLVTDVAFWNRSIGSEARVYELAHFLSSQFSLGVFFIDKDGSYKKPDIPYHISSSSDPDLQTSKKTPSSKDKSKSNLEAFGKFCQKHKPLVGIYEYLKLDEYAHIPNAPQIKILDSHDLFSARTKTFRRFSRKHFIEMTEHEELERFNEFNTVVAIQAEDIGFIKSALGEDRALYVPFSMEYRAKTHRNKVKSIVMVGGNSPMNADGFRWFLSQIWPLVRREGISVEVCGDVCKSLPKNDKSVNLHGRVTTERLLEIYDNADIAINPVFYGGGLKIKAVEYAANGLPSVCTPEAVRGIRRTDHDPFIVASTRAEFSEGLSRLITDLDSRLQLASECEPFIDRNYSGRETRELASYIASSIEALS